jgi:hypothetical protein
MKRRTDMLVRCGFDGCTEKVIAVFQVMVPAASTDDLYAELPSKKIAWCLDHQQDGRNRAALKRGRLLSGEEIAKLV